MRRVSSLVQELGHAAAVDAADAPVDEGAQVAQDQALRQQKFSDSGRRVIRASGSDRRQPVVEREGGATGHTRPVGDGAAGGARWYPLRPPVRAPSIRRSASESTCSAIRAEMVRSRTRLRIVSRSCPASADQAQRDPVAVENVGAVLGRGHGSVEAFCRSAWPRSGRCRGSARNSRWFRATSSRTGLQRHGDDLPATAPRRGAGGGGGESRSRPSRAITQRSVVPLHDQGVKKGKAGGKGCPRRAGCRRAPGSFR